MPGVYARQYYYSTVELELSKNRMLVLLLKVIKHHFREYTS